MCLSSPSSPFNDNPCSAASIPAANFCSNANGFTNVGATSESLFSTSIPTCWDAAGAQNTVWFTYTAIGAGNIIQVIGGGTGGLQRPQVIVLQTSNCAGTTWNASVFGCAQAASGVNSVTLNTNNNLIGGQTYLIGVDGFGGNTGSFQLCLNSFVPTSTVPNDLCSGAYSICPNQVFSASTQNATNTGDVPIGNWTCNGDLTKPVWYTFRTAATVNPISITISGTCTQSTSSGPGQIQFEVFNYTGTGNVCSGTNVNSMTSIGCTTTLSGTVNIPAASLQPNRTYYILVDDYPGSYCNFQFVLTGIPSTDAGVDQNVCESAAAFNLVGVPNGGQWFGPGITDATLGTFNPSVASIGSQTVYYRVGNCTDSKVINVTGVDLQLPNDMTICLGGSAQLSANAAPLPSTLIRTFSNNTITAIPDGNTTGITSNVTVSGVAPNTVGTNPIQRICLNIAHPSDNNLDISLIAPNGTVIDLSSDNGGTGDNYTNTCFVTGATSIASGTAPFTGDFAPEGSLTGAGISASAVNGTWGLRVIDDSGGNIGSLINWSIQFAQANSITYSWSPTTNMTNANTLSPTVSPTVNTTYTLTATDVTGCTASDAMVVSIVTPTVTITGNSLICPGGSTTLTASGSGTGTYLWSTGAVTSAITVNPSTTTIYAVTYNQGGCTATATVTVTISAITLTDTNTSVTCNGGTNGSVNLTVAGGTSPYTYNWGGVATEDRTNLTAGIYTVTVTDASSCTATRSVTITQPTAITLTNTSVNSSCNGGSNGSINLTVSGGTTPYTYNWGGVVTEDRTNLTAGVYTVTVTDANSCTATRSVTITQPTAITLTNTSVNVNCNGGTTGSINLTVSGGTTPYTYNWGGVVTEDRTNLAAGIYTVTVTDANSCTATRSVTITQPTAITLTNTSVNVSCNGGTNGSIDLTVAGGTMPYTYNWGGVVTEDRTNLTAGVYTVTVTDANSCTATRSVTITQPTAITLTNTSVNVSCNGGVNGSIDLTVSGGTTPYTYNWGGVVTEDRTNLTAGVYTVTVTDANSCTAARSVTITQPTAITLTNTTTSASCNGGTNGSIDLTVLGGTIPYTYNWGGGIITEDRIGLAANTYAVTVTDANSCTATKSIIVTELTGLSLTNTSVNVSCNGGSNGSIDLTAAGGITPYTYNWGGVSTEDRTGLVAGIYTVTVTDVNLCSSIKSIAITQPTAITLTNTSVNVSCNGGTNGSIDLTVVGGTMPYSYNWGGVVAEDRTNLAAGTYTVTVTDANNCTATRSVTITQPTAITLTNTSVNVSCNGGSNGSIDLTVAGGTTPYTYNWGGVVTEDRTNLTAGIYTVTVTDANNCTAIRSVTITQPTAITLTNTSVNVSCNGGSAGSIDLTVAGGTTPYTYNWGGVVTEDRTNLMAGIYTVTVTDASSCTATRSVTITQPTAITLTNTSVNVSCNGGSNGSIDLTVSGGTTPYTYNWGGITTEDRIGLAVGVYTVTVTDANNCTAARSITITQPTVITLTNTSINASCNGGSNGSIDLTVSGGTTPYTYNWGGAVTEDRTNLTAGIYTVTVTDANSCTATRSVTITQPTAITISSVITNASCSNLNGAIDVTVFGGRTPYTYNWGGVITEDRAGLAAGSYTLTVTDANACTSSQTFNLTTTVAVTATIVAPTRVLTCSTINIELNASTSVGGGTPLTYLWSTGEATSSITITAPNTYRVTVTETSSGCQGVQLITITTDYLKPTITLTSSSPSITCNTQLVVLDASGSRGTGALTYVWSTGLTSTMITVSNAGTYNVTVTNISNGCTATDNITVLSDNASPNIAISNSTPLLNCRDVNSVLGVSLVNELFPIQVSWSNGQAITPITVNTPNTYTVTVTNITNGCSSRTSTTVTQDIAAPNVSISAPITQFTCSTTRLDLTAQSQLGALASFAWSTGSLATTITTTTAGMYRVTVTNNSNFCTSATAVTLTSNTTPPAIVFAPGIRELNCILRTLNIDASGSTGQGTLRYNWSNNQTANNINVTGPGVVTLMLTDVANGCTSTASQTVTENIQAPTSVITPSATVLTCRTPLIELNANSSAPLGTLSFLWSVNNDSRPIITISAAGVYQLMVTNSINGCTATSNQTITTVPNTLQALASTTPALCNGGSTGSATINTTGGTAPISYLWSTSQNTATIAGLIAGSYQAVVTDANGCSTNVTATVLEPTVILLQAVAKPVLCNGDSNGEITLSTNGGTPNYTYSWSNRQTTANLTGISAGNYCVTVADAHNCQATTCINVATPQPVVITNTSVQNVTCFNADNGTIRVNVTGGLPNYTYNWSVLPSTNSNTLTGLKSGSYSLNVLDANGCKANQNFTITSPEPIQMTYNSTNLVCYGNESGSININQVSGGTTPYKFSIDGTNFGSNKVYTNLEAGSYSLYVRDLNGCTYTSPSITLTQPSQIQVVLSATKQTIELGDTTILNASILGRPNNLTFSWSPKDSLSCTTCERNILAYPSHTTSYRLTVESDKGCEAHNDITIVVNKNRSVYIPTGFTPNNDGINDAFMVYSAKGIKNIKTFRVFDRWGELLFENNNSKPNEPTSGWGGFFKNKAMIPDVYVYLIEIEFVDGFNQIYKGTVNLIH